MDCSEFRPLVEADADHELDLVRHLALESHLRGCPACAQAAESARARRAALRDALPRFTAPPHLADRIRATLGTPAPAVAPTPTRAKPWQLAWNLGGLAAGLVAAAYAGFTWGEARTRAGLLTHEAIADHVRSLQVNHLTDVASTDQHTVKPWFAGKLDFSPPVTDLATAGYPLTGGRLEHFAGRPAAALVFHRRQHAINLFIWPGLPAAEGQADADGYNTLRWSRDGLNFLAVSEIPPAELADFAAAYRTATR